MPEDDSGGHTKWTPNLKVSAEEELFGRLCIALAGTAAEDMFLTESTPLTNFSDMVKVRYWLPTAASYIYEEVCQDKFVLITIQH